MRPLKRSLMTLTAVVVAGFGALAARSLWANGVFSHATPGFSGICRTVAGLSGVEDIEIDAADKLAFISVSSARGPRPGDGLYVMPLAGPGGLVKLSGTPSDFHPRGIGLYRTPGGGVFLMAVNRRARDGRFAIDSFDVNTQATAPTLSAEGTIEGGLLTDPQDVAVAGPGTFYVSNNTADKRPVLGGLMTRLAGLGVAPASQILFFNGTVFRPAVEGLYDARGLLLTPDGAHLIVASLTGRAIRTLNRDLYSGNLEEAGSLTLDAAPEKMALDKAGDLWVAGHASLPAWRAFAGDAAKPAPSQVFRVHLANGVPQDAAQVYGNDGHDLSAASVGAVFGSRLLMGSSLDTRLLDCTLR